MILPLNEPAACETGVFLPLNEPAPCETGGILQLKAPAACETRGNQPHNENASCEPGGKKKDREEDEVVRFEEDGETGGYDLECNSLLNHAGRNLPSTMLGWHYRSRDEALISFSNWAFYAGRLLTIPEESIRSQQKSELSVETASAAVEHVGATLDRPISFHHVRSGVYESRKNRSEADYIASLIRELLLKDDGRTLGVIAFSEAQQSEIEAAE